MTQKTIERRQRRFGFIDKNDSGEAKEGWRGSNHLGAMSAPW
jgi:hypothetical protein